MRYALKGYDYDPETKRQYIKNVHQKYYKKIKKDIVLKTAI